MRRFAVALGLVMLAGCTYTHHQWTLELLPPGEIDRQLQDDHAACAKDAKRASEGVAVTNPWTVYERCMATKGR